jgi:hypothetical protein
MKKALGTLFALLLMVSSSYAHNGMEHVMGTVASITDNFITVTTTDGKTQTVTATADTKYSKMNAAIALKDIKVGDHVVIHATKKDNKLIAATVQVGMGKMAGMKMDGKKHIAATKVTRSPTTTLRCWGTAGRVTWAAPLILRVKGV